MLGREVLRLPRVPVHRHEDVVRAPELRCCAERIDQDETVVRLDGDRADLLLPLVVPGRPAA